ncbi:MAG: sulfite exporter TauE/SafE family protein [Vicinamibacterales bacterium]
MPSWLGLVGLALAGVGAGALNIVAGGGSFLTLPLLIFYGLPAGMANGTNRIGVVTQNIGGVWGFHRHGTLNWRWALGASVPALIGAAFGVWAALSIPDFAFKRILSVAMVVMTLFSIAGQRRVMTRQAVRPPSHWTVVGGFFLAGLYGGFIQAGVGFLILAVTTAAGMDLVRGNAVKALSVLLLTLLSLAAFATAGQVDWPSGLALGFGNFVGGFIGVRVAVLRGHAWLEKAVVVTVILFAVLLWLN